MYYADHPVCAYSAGSALSVSIVLKNDSFQSVWWEKDTVWLIDQQLLPTQDIAVRCATLDDIIRAICTLQVRGAPAIGCTAAYGLAQVARQSTSTTTTQIIEELTHAKTRLDAARPTAVNLAWATERMLQYACKHASNTPDTLRDKLLDEAHAIYAEDLAMCLAIGRHGLALIPARGHVLTHCNAGGLATAGYGTALAPIRLAHEQGRPIHAFVDETRPFLQGARLTTWELQRAGVPHTLITDSMAGYFMQRGEIDCVIVGADRVVANGDIANKIGTYSVAVLAHAHDIPFYVAAPSSTVDFMLASGDHIPIEQRDPAEVTTFAGRQIAPIGVVAAHPAFDVTPHALITALITERGIIYPPYTTNLRTTLNGAADHGSSAAGVFG